ncbi:hypothetical protein Acsp05_73020 [Actinokineospora sp. NBRC 105648]|nr:hypothetical protein Acsp05_73020 [Actinokineospora sp. NBRC 105648]
MLDWLDCLRAGPLGDRVGKKRGEKGIPTTEASLAVASPHTKAVQPIEHVRSGCCVPAGLGLGMQNVRDEELELGRGLSAAAGLGA